MTFRRVDKFTKEEHTIGSQLAQAVLTTTPTSYYTPPENREVFIPIGGIVITNVLNQSRWFSMWVDADGTGVTNSELVENEFDVESDDIWTNPFEIRLNSDTANISFSAEADTVLTMTIHGTETDLG